MPTQLTTQRLHLRLIELADLAQIHGLFSLPETDEYNALGIPKDMEASRVIIEPLLAANSLTPIQTHTFAIENKESGAFLGLFGFALGKAKYARGEVWYKLYPSAWKQGFATEALRAVIAYGFNTLNLHRIEAGCAVENVGSVRVLEKAGMTKEGRCRKVLPLKTGWSDTFEFAILESDERGPEK
jgi:ribosomal-protein-alanine N-acetyltransferase